MSLSYAGMLDKSSQRLEKKTRDGLFHHALSTEFNFSPRECSGVLDLMNDLYFGLRPLSEGQVRYIAVHKDERSGKRMEDLRKVEVLLTMESSDDKITSNCKLRLVQILRMTEEAYEQDGLLTQEDLSRLLGLSLRQVRRDIKAQAVQDESSLQASGIDESYAYFDRGSHRCSLRCDDFL